MVLLTGTRLDVQRVGVWMMTLAAVGVLVANELQEDVLKAQEKGETTSVASRKTRLAQVFLENLQHALSALGTGTPRVVGCVAVCEAKGSHPLVQAAARLQLPRCHFELRRLAVEERVHEPQEALQVARLSLRSEEQNNHFCNARP